MGGGVERHCWGGFSLAMGVIGWLRFCCHGISGGGCLLCGAPIGFVKRAAVTIVIGCMIRHGKRRGVAFASGARTSTCSGVLSITSRLFALLGRDGLVRSRKGRRRLSLCLTGRGRSILITLNTGHGPTPGGAGVRTMGSRRSSTTWFRGVVPFRVLVTTW